MPPHVDTVATCSPFGGHVATQFKNCPPAGNSSDTASVATHATTLAAPRVMRRLRSRALRIVSPGKARKR